MRISAREDLAGRSHQAAYGEVRLVPSSPLLFDLGEIELGFGGVQGSGDSDEGFTEEFDISSEPTAGTIVPPTESLLGEAEPPSPEHAAGVCGGDSLIVNDLGTIVPPSDPLPDEVALRVRHTEYSSMLTSSATPAKGFKLPAMYINAPTSREMLPKDIGDTHVFGKKDLNAKLTSLRQEESTRIQQLIGDSPVTESKLQLAPRWLLDQAIVTEKANYMERGAYQPISIREVPRNSNIISSHHFFQVKRDGEASKLKFKCRLVPHGNRDVDKQSLRSDSSTAQFPCTRVLLSLAVLFHFDLASLEIATAYLQAGTLKRDIYIYMRPPRDWTTYIDEVWKLLKPAYGLVESGRLWQLCIEEWTNTYGFETIPGLPQLFVLRRASQQRAVSLIAAKVVDDILLAGTSKELERFFASISNRFKVGRYISGRPFVFNRVLISPTSDHSASLSMSEFMETIELLPLTRTRRKQHEEKCTQKELTALQSLAGKLNFLGHGFQP